MVCTGNCLPIGDLPWYAEFIKVWSRAKTLQYRCVDDVIQYKRVAFMCDSGETRSYRIRVVRSCKCKKYLRNQNESPSDYQQKRTDNYKKRRQKKLSNQSDGQIWFFRVVATVQRSLVHGNGGPMVRSMIRQFTLWAIGSETTMEVCIYLDLCRSVILSILVVHLALLLRLMCCIISEKRCRKNLLVLLTELCCSFCDAIIIINQLTADLL